MRIWSLINSRLVVALFTAAVMLTVGWMFLRNFSRAFDNSDSLRVDTLARIQLLSLREVEVPDGHPQKFVGKVRNNSKLLVTGITGAVAFYDEANALKDLFVQGFDGLSLFGAGQEAEFSISRPNSRDAAGVVPMKTKATRVELRFVDVSISREKR